MNSIITRLITCCLILAAVLSCTVDEKQSDEGTSPEKGRQMADSLNFITYSSEAVSGQAVYIPVYSHIYERNKKRTFNLTATLSLRNTDLASAISIEKVFYFDSDGNLVHRYLDEPMPLSPMSSISFVVEEEDLRGGVGANFLVLWEAQKPVIDPIMEAVMISTAQQQGLSFVSRGRVIHRLDRAAE